MKFLLLFILLFTASVSFAEKHVILDTSSVTVRNFDAQELQQLKEDGSFQYEQLQRQSANVWNRFWTWVWWKIAEIMSTKSGSRTVYTTLIIIAVVVIVFFVLRLMGMNKSSLLSRKSGDTLPFTISTDDINNISFEDAIRTAIENRNFRMAVRLLYLQSLKQLSDKGYIQWQINKTNSDYLKEISGRQWQASFKKLTYNFECTWYGDMKIAKEQFDDLNLQFQQFNSRLQ
jgi:hypothetical protein